MRISSLRTEKQLLLFEPQLGNHGHIRTLIGDLAEELTAEYLGGRRHKTQGTSEYCPDVSRGGVYFESKAVGKTRCAFVYKGRLEKDRAFAQQHPLAYVIWHHLADTTSVTSVPDLRALVLKTLRTVFIVPFSAIDRICRGLSAERLNSKYGNHNDNRPGKMYGSGYRIRLKLLDRWAHETFAGGVSQVMREGWRTCLPV